MSKKYTALWSTIVSYWIYVLSKSYKTNLHNINQNQKAT